MAERHNRLARESTYGRVKKDQAEALRREGKAFEFAGQATMGGAAYLALTSGGALLPAAILGGAAGGITAYNGHVMQGDARRMRTKAVVMDDMIKRAQTARFEQANKHYEASHMGHAAGDPAAGGGAADQADIVVREHTRRRSAAS